VVAQLTIEYSFDAFSAVQALKDGGSPMTLVRWNPRSSFGPHREINDLVNRFWGDWPTSQESEQPWSPNVDVAENDDHFAFHAELPGMNREEIKVTMHEGVLTLEGERKQDSDSQENGFYRKESAFGKFSRSFRLSAEVDADKVSASYKNGILSLTVPKKEAATPKQVEVKAS
jgi:HSP20 family protein